MRNSEDDKFPGVLSRSGERGFGRRGGAEIQGETKRMPFGKYQGRLLIDLPEPYVVWRANQGFPEGKLGRMLQVVYEIKANGLEYLFVPLQKGRPGR